jgi:choice-of-anchor A domain-containing protein/uncharacterized protein (TIGR03382 family)
MLTKNIFGSNLRQLITVTLITLVHPLECQGAALGVANDYNVFVAGNFTATGADTGGRIAVGGTASFPGYYSIGDAILDSFIAPNNDTLDVGGNISVGPAQVYYGNNTDSLAGNAYEGSLGKSTAVMIEGGSLVIGGANPIDFASQSSFLSSYAAQLGQATANSTVNNNGYGTITLTGTDPTLEIFDLPIADLGGSDSLYLNVNSSATVLINVMGTSVTTSNSGFFLNGTQIIGNTATGYDKILFNFYQATDIAFGGTFQGTVLAPNANVTGGNGQLDGGLIAQSYNGSIEFHDLLFNGTLPAYTAPTPEPAPFVLCGAGLVLLGMVRRRRTTP